MVLPVIITCVFRCAFILTMLLRQVASSLDNNPITSQEPVSSGPRLPLNNPMTSSLRRGSMPYHRSGPPPDTRNSPDKYLKPSSEEVIQSDLSYNLKDDFCKAYTIAQRIEEPGCIPRTITNRLCYGQCNSFYIPKQSSDYNQAFKSCSFCKPHKVAYVTISLRCPGQDPPVRTRRVKRIKKCRCMPVDVS